MEVFMTFDPTTADAGKFWIGDTDSTGAYSEIEGLVSVELPEIKGEPIVSEWIGQTLKHKRKNPSIDPGVCNLELLYDADGSNQSVVIGLADDATEKFFKWSWDALGQNGYRFKGFVTSAKVGGIGVGQDAKLSVTIDATTLATVVGTG
jgi:hypothetical protein